MSVWNYLLDTEFNRRLDIDYIKENMAYDYEVDQIRKRSIKGMRHDKKQDEKMEVLEERLNELLIFQKAFMKYMSEDQTFDMNRFLQILSDLNGETLEMAPTD